MTKPTKRMALMTLAHFEQAVRDHEVKGMYEEAERNEIIARYELAKLKMENVLRDLSGE